MRFPDALSMLLSAPSAAVLVLRRMYADGPVLRERDGAATRIERHAEDAPRERPDILASATVESRRYVITDARDDLADAVDVTARRKASPMRPWRSSPPMGGPLREGYARTWRAAAEPAAHPAQTARTVSTVSASVAVLSGRWRRTRAKRRATPAG